MLRFYEAIMGNGDRWHVRLLGARPPIGVWDCARYVAGTPVRFETQVVGTAKDYNRTSFAMVVVSRRIGELLESMAPGEVQRVPEIVDDDADNWEVLNIISKVDCIDHARSVISFYPENDPEKPGKPCGVWLLVLDVARARGHDVFRPRDWEVVPVISERVKTALEKAGATGIEYRRVTESFGSGRAKLHFGPGRRAAGRTRRWDAPAT